MNLPPVIQEKLMKVLEQQMERLINDPKPEFEDVLDGEDDGQIDLANITIRPWEICDIFDLGDSDPAVIIDRYRLKARTTIEGQYSYIDGSLEERLECERWYSELMNLDLIPVFSPRDVLAAYQMMKKGDLGCDPPPLVCETDNLLRNLARGYENVEDRFWLLAKEAHDLSLLEAALRNLGSLEQLIQSKRVWKTEDLLSRLSAKRYLRYYGNSELENLREIYGLARQEHPLSTQWVSPSIIPHIEKAKAYRKAVQEPRWLLYKAVVIKKGRLCEDEHNQMLAAAITDDRFARAYLKFNSNKKWGLPSG